MTGDFRTNENLGLAVIQTIWVRFHNIVVSNLPQRQDANIAMQEARRVTTAMYLHIVYNEYLPLLIGKVSKVVGRAGTIYDNSLQERE